MKRIFALLILALVVGAPGLRAQQKIAYVDIGQIMKSIPDAQEAQRKLDAMVDSWQKELDGLQKDWQQKFNDYDKRKLILTDQGRASAEKELRELDRKILDFRDKKFGQSGELFQKEDELMKPIQNLVFDQVKQFAVESGYDYVLDKSAGSMMIYGKESLDLTAKLIDRITKTLPARKVAGEGQQGQQGQQGQPGMNTDPTRQGQQDPGQQPKQPQPQEPPGPRK
jgi:outer membrane protein